MEAQRKNLWQLAEFAGHPNPDRLQGFLARAAWDTDELRDRARDCAAAALAADDAVLIGDETGDITPLRGTGVPPERTTTMATNPEPARHMLKRAPGAGVPFTSFLADEAYGQCRALRGRLEERRCAMCRRCPRPRCAAAGRPHPAGSRVVRPGAADVQLAPGRRHSSGSC
ncbi:transposase [Streptomyces sp. NPDC102462]|uniref:transposase n=1 Tax=Streptomyces sp. NPDC102462 TaxID=3366178 RepID=UPI003827E6E7